ncbi:hypothetical protein C8R43DRAFT_1126400 [Mycena crocata]|nr:hypothetical protein C8R43DRAFT_1126400 [Mycena crocata]
MLFATRDDTAAANDLPDPNPYGYVPKRPSPYSSSLKCLRLHVGQAVYYGMWWLFPTAALCGVGELLGWGARLMSSSDVLASNPFTQDLCHHYRADAAPGSKFRGLFTCGSPPRRVIFAAYTNVIRECSSLVTSSRYIALLIQGIGGGIASGADTANLGANVMLSGISFRFVVIIVFSALSRFLPVLHA